MDQPNITGALLMLSYVQVKAIMPPMFSELKRFTAFAFYVKIISMFRVVQDFKKGLLERRSPPLFEDAK